MADAITILGSGAFSSVLVFVFRAWITDRLKASIQHEYDQKLEAFKIQLQSKAEQEMVLFKTRLEIDAAERNFRFSHVFEQTAETIATTYAKLVTLRRAVEVYTQCVGSSADANKTKLSEDVVNQFHDFLEYYPRHKIYIPNSTAASIKDFCNTLWRMVSQFNRMNSVEKQLINNRERIDETDRQIESLHEESSKLLVLLEKDFQRILGFPAEPKLTA